ncbi:hypothetical protein B0O80DRAFT_503052 [Mortierella sp. GBAus27b]|nr:hypothetical protein BGX31_006479 [Mortierella sp. GBA43]KAI8346928.1 hypothetical protein B0O80DRAFT_503052 [Mortierella sp. GBAus27b]
METANRTLTSQSLSPLELPEIVIAMGRQLKLKHLIQCVRVCKLWYIQLIPYLWRVITVRKWNDNCSTGVRTPDLDVLAKHRDYVGTLIIEGVPFSSDMTFPNLEDVRLRAVHFQVRVDYQRLLERHTFITSLHLDGLNDIRDSHSMLKLIPQLARLKSLSINEFTMEEDQVSDFWNACKNVECLALTAIRFSHTIVSWEEQGIPTFPCLRTLDFENTLISPFLQLIKHCPGLESLRWVFILIKPTDTSVMDDLGDSAENGAWPHLESLCIETQGCSDEKVAKILRSMKSIVRLNVPYSNFGKESYSFLQPHLGHLTGLDFRECPNVTTAMILEIVQSSTQLTRLTASKVSAHEMAAPWLPSDDGLVKSKSTTRDRALRPWACLQLRRLEMRFVLDDTKLPSNRNKAMSARRVQVELDRVRSRIFDQLARLRKLRQLQFGFHHVKNRGRRALGTPSDGDSSDDEVDSTNNIRKFEKLTSLRRITLYRDNILAQELDDQDIHWMLKHWEDLEAVTGSWSAQREVGDRHQKILSQGNVLCYHEVFDEDGR